MVPYRDARTVLPGLLEALAAQTIGTGAFEVLLVNDRSRDGGLDERSVPASLSLRQLECEGSGPYAARNVGIRAACGAALAFTDADCRPRPDWLEQGLLALEHTPRAAGRVLLTTTARESLAEQLDRSRFLRQERYAKEGFGATANLLWRRSVIDDVGLFDERLLSGADEEHGERASRQGIAIHYAEAAVVVHPARATLFDVARKAERVGCGVGQKVRLHGVDPARLFARARDRISLAALGQSDDDDNVEERSLMARALLAGGHASLAVCSGVGVARGLFFGERLLSPRRGTAPRRARRGPPRPAPRAR